MINRLVKIPEATLYSGFKSIRDFLNEVGEAFYFFLNGISQLFSKPFRWQEIIKQMEFVGNKSLGIIMLTGLFTGLALTYQIWIGFSILGATNLVGPTVALGITRELGPVFTGLIVAARAGGAMAAQIGTMKVSEQIDALKVMGVNPIQYLVSPRLIASFIMLPFLCAVFDFTAMFGSRFLSVTVLNLDEAVYWDKIAKWIYMSDILEGLFKSAGFGLAFATICTFKGYKTTGGAKGVGEATNKGVVTSMVMIIVLDYILTNVVRAFVG